VVHKDLSRKLTGYSSNNFVQYLKISQENRIWQTILPTVSKESLRKNRIHQTNFAIKPEISQERKHGMIHQN
jgi:hypothetical protein